MKSWAETVRNEKGVALPLALFALVSLTAFVLTFVSMGGMEPQVARNLSDSTQARYSTDAGIEWAFDQLANPATNWSTVLANNPVVAGSNPRAVWLTGANGAPTTLPGLAATFGTYTVQIRNDSLAADQTLTGVAPELGVTTADTNFAVIVTATGAYRGVSRQIQVVISRVRIPTMPGALNCGGLQCTFDMGVVSDWTNHHFHSSGLDYAQDPLDPTSMVGVASGPTNPMKYAIAVSPGNQNQSGTFQGQFGNVNFETNVENALNMHQINEMDGQNQTQPAGTAVVSRQYDGAGKNTIAADNSLISKVDNNGYFVSNPTSKFVDMLKAQPGVQALTGTGGNGITVNNGVTTGANKNLSFNLGTVQSPTISYFSGDKNPSNNDRVLSLKGTNSGAGILIVENGTLQIYDSFRWDGIIIVTGENAGVSFDKSVVANVYGGIMLNETRRDKDTPDYELSLQKNNEHGEDGFATGVNDIHSTKLYSSQQRRDQAQSIRSLVKMTTWREM